MSCANASWCSSGPSRATRPIPRCSALAAGLVPDIEEVGDAFRAAELTTNPDGTIHLQGTLEFNQSATLAHLQMQLIQLRLLGRRGGLLLESDPQVTQLLPGSGTSSAIRSTVGRPGATTPPRSVGPSEPRYDERARGAVAAGNVLYITVDQWRGDCLSASPATRWCGRPNLDRLAARGVRFANHWSVDRAVRPEPGVAAHRHVPDEPPVGAQRHARSTPASPTSPGRPGTLGYDPDAVRLHRHQRRPAHRSPTPTIPACATTRACCPASPRAPSSPWHNMAPWLEWLDGRGHRRAPTPGTTCSTRSRLPGRRRPRRDLGAHRGSPPSTPRPRS